MEKTVQNLQIEAMKKRNDDVIYLTREEVDAFHEQKHRERLALRRRVERGELTPLEANREASIFKPEVFDPALAQTVNFDQVVDNLLKLKARSPNGRRKQKAVRV